MEKQPPVDYKAPEAKGARIDNPAGDGLDRDRAYDSGFKYHIPEAGSQPQPTGTAGGPPEYQAQSVVGNDRPSNKGTEMGERLGSGVRGVFAGIHGAGEWLRGGINAAVDRTFGSEEGVTRNEAISRAGQEEIRSGKFSRDTHTGAWNRPNSGNQ
ncbi:hypothetical protein BJY04DRAFT_223071 [Aspergillus karnatakaensis]|uniref:uncharacterized protein n=1 Tax=Aspergillus karnatakaensis TaxID=1810916 RepID=UPI003CCDD70E